jgi:putative transcriptional regulator
MGSLSGKLLVASPDLTDPNFARTVILVVEHGAGGALGLVLNRAGPARLDAIWDETADGPCPVGIPAMAGGPLEGPLMVVHGPAADAQREIVADVSFSLGADRLVALVAEGCLPVRVFIGYAGWGGDQLEDELRAGAWTVTTATADFVFADPDTLWDRVTRHVADTRLAAALRIRHVPAEPWHN